MSAASVTLSTLLPGQQAIVLSINAPEFLHQRFRAMGFRIGRPVRLMRGAAFRGPLQVRLGPTDVIIRRIDACMIEVTCA